MKQHFSGTVASSGFTILVWALIPSRDSRLILMTNWDVPTENNSESESASRYIEQPPLTSTVDDSKVRSSDFIRILCHISCIDALDIPWSMVQNELVWSFERLFSFWTDVSMTDFGKLENGKLSACICKQIRKEFYIIAPVCVIFVLLCVIQIFFQIYLHLNKLNYIR